jgi:hypothetical protein
VPIGEKRLSRGRVSVFSRGKIMKIHEKIVKIRKKSSNSNRFIKSPNTGRDFSGKSLYFWLRFWVGMPPKGRIFRNVVSLDRYPRVGKDGVISYPLVGYEFFFFTFSPQPNEFPAVSPFLHRTIRPTTATGVQRGAKRSRI